MIPFIYERFLLWYFDMTSSESIPETVLVVVERDGSRKRVPVTESPFLIGRGAPTTSATTFCWPTSTSPAVRQRWSMLTVNSELKIADNETAFS